MDDDFDSDLEDYDPSQSLRTPEQGGIPRWGRWMLGVVGAVALVGVSWFYIQDQIEDKRLEEEQEQIDKALYEQEQQDQRDKRTEARQFATDRLSSLLVRFRSTADKSSKSQSDYLWLAELGYEIEILRRCFEFEYEHPQWRPDQETCGW